MQRAAQMVRASQHSLGGERVGTRTQNLRHAQMMMSDCMSRGPNVAMCLCTVSYAKQDLSYFCMCACCPFSKRLTRLSGQLAIAYLGIASHCSNTKFGSEVPNKRRSLHGAVAACLIHRHPDLLLCFFSRTYESRVPASHTYAPMCPPSHDVCLGRFTDLDTLACHLVRTLSPPCRPSYEWIGDFRNSEIRKVVSSYRPNSMQWLNCYNHAGKRTHKPRG